MEEHNDQQIDQIDIDMTINLYYDVMMKNELNTIFNDHYLNQVILENNKNDNFKTIYNIDDCQSELKQSNLYLHFAKMLSTPIS